ncbi:Uncharacterised protein [Streptococcus pneumoniae]|nr:Uncharacterised protein [Streptococcus pneumoniae]CKG24253.1 Uncharacterised protein [Streptococcus pneumoniae]
MIVHGLRTTTSPSFLLKAPFDFLTFTTLFFFLVNSSFIEVVLGINGKNAALPKINNKAGKIVKAAIPIMNTATLNGTANR